MMAGDAVLLDADAQRRLAAWLALLTIMAEITK